MHILISDNIVIYLIDKIYFYFYFYYCFCTYSVTPARTYDVSVSVGLSTKILGKIHIDISSWNSSLPA